jgi:hypothetical protein
MVTILESTKKTTTLTSKRHYKSGQETGTVLVIKGIIEKVYCEKEMYFENCNRFFSKNVFSLEFFIYLH